jgi:lysophospholipase L1-like esterase
VWKLFANNSGNYQFEIRFANGATTSRSGQLSINNGANGTYNLNLPATGAWTSWQTISIPLVLSQGENQLVLTATTSGGLANVDYAKVFGVGLTPRDCVTTTAPNITVWLAGDSTVANGSSVCPIGWGRNFASNFDSRVTVQNLAAGGRSVRTWLYDVQSTMGTDGECLLNYNADGTPVLQARWQTMLNGMKSGDYLLIQFGINDGDRTCPRHVGSSAFMQSYAMMAQAARARGATPIFITPVSAIACSGSTAIATRGFLSETASAGSANAVKVIDLHAQSIQLYNNRAFCPIPGGTDVSATTGGAAGAFFCDDHTHFDTAGANDIGVLVAQAIRNLNIPLAQYLK